MLIVIDERGGLLGCFFFYGVISVGVRKLVVYLYSYFGVVSFLVDSFICNIFVGNFCCYI